MNKFLIVTFSALLCLTIVKCLKCYTCNNYKNGKCKEGEGICETHFSNTTCGTIIFKESKKMVFNCGLKLFCDVFDSKTNNVPLYFTCCNKDFCNWPAPRKPDNETSMGPNPQENF